MNITETSLGLLFTEYHFSNWIECFAIIFLVLIFFSVKYLVSNYKDYDGMKRVFFVLFVASFVYLCINSALLFFPISQYNSDFKVELNYKHKSQQVILSSNNRKLIYTDNLLNYKAFYIEFEHSSQKSTNNNVMGKYHLYLLRKDGLLLSLDRFGITTWKDIVLPLLKKTELPLMTDTNILDIETNTEDIQLNYDVTQLSKNLKFGTFIQNKNESVYQLDLHGNKILNAILIPLLLLLWTGAILFSMHSKSERLFYFFFLLLFSASWVFYYALCFGKHYNVFSDSGYHSYTTNIIIKESNGNKGNWNDVKKAIAYIGNGNSMGVTLYETNISAHFTDILYAVSGGKTKTIQLDGIEWYDQILLADYVLSQSHKTLNK
ncbi:MAG: hypothetical protein KAZ71_00325 [Bacteroidia bacterium]|nr:hypothetical protein [Bacteroidia bacterium]